MLDVINRYAHGFVALPIICAFERYGVFSTITDCGGITASRLAAATHANDGHLWVALRLLESIGWVRRTDDQFWLLPAAEERRFVPGDFDNLYLWSGSDLLKGRAPFDIAHLCELSQTRWEGAAPLTADLIDGGLLLPMLFELGRITADEKAEAESARLLQEAPGLAGLFCGKGWGEGSSDGRILYTHAGRYLLNRAYSAGTVLSYRPMFARIGDVIFGDCKSVFERGRDGNESHVDRTLNVSASGFQHQKYFADLVDAVVKLFDNENLEEQPRYVMDVGCGDGSLLCAIYHAIEERTPRGKQLEAHPLTLIAADYNQLAREEAARRLADLPHITIEADVGDPVRILERLEKLGIGDPDSILHVRSFIDHERPLTVSSQQARCFGRRSESISVDGEGNLVPRGQVTESLVELLKEWRDVIGRHGLFVLEVHSLPSTEAKRFINESESIHFDAYHGFSGQHLVEPDIFLSAAASAGLFATENSLRFPREFPFTRITLNHFVTRPYQIRPAVPEDIPALISIEAECWSDALRTDGEKIAWRAENHGADQFVVTIDEEPVGVCYTQPITDIEGLRFSKWETVDNLRAENGRTLQLLGLNVLPDHRGGGIGDRLLEFVLEWARSNNDFDQVVGVSRCADYRPKEILDEFSGGLEGYKAYVARRDVSGFSVDSTLKFHQSHGARLSEVVEDYRPKDSGNLSCGVLIEYVFHETNPTSEGQHVKPAERGTGSVDDIAGRITDLVNSIEKQSKRPSEIDVSRTLPFMEMGLDSVQLLSLRSLLGEAFDCELESTYLFRYPTIDAVARDIAAKTKGQSGQTEPASDRLPTADIRSGDIAIIGMSCRFPGGDLRGFWRLLTERRDGIARSPDNRWWMAEPKDAEEAALDVAGYTEDIDAFDARLFRISPAEAELMDPQQRMLLQLSWELFEDVGVDPSSVHGSSIGVWIGACNFDYRELLAQNDKAPGGHRATGTFGSILANRISYFYDLSGPSLSIDTACSSALVAVDAAVTALRGGVCREAIVGGVNLICSRSTSRSIYRAGMLSKTGRCHSFDDAADGYVRAEGAGLLLLKPLDQAIKDGDRIDGVIKGTAVNHGGRASSLTAPNPESQCNVLLRAYEDADLTLSDIQYLEAHGTGTALGDPIEVAGLSAAFERQDHPKLEHRQDRYIGSVKSNVGHAEAAAGIAGIIKVLLSMRHGWIPGNLHFQHLNANIDLDGLPFQIAARNIAWPHVHDHQPMRAGVSSFGFGGVSAHVILEQGHAPQLPENECESVAIVFSAASEGQLRETATRLLAYLDESEQRREARPSLRDIAWTLQSGRAAMAERVAFVSTSFSDLMGKLTSISEGMLTNGVYRGRVAASLWEDNQRNDTLERPSIETVDAGEQLEGVVQRWVKGDPVNWERYYPGVKPNRVRLPNYPFVKDRFWLSPPRHEDQQADRKQNPKLSRHNQTEDVADTGPHMLLSPEWKVKAPPRVPAWPVRSERVLVVGGDEDVFGTIKSAYPHADWIADHKDPCPVLKISEYFTHCFWIAPDTALNPPDLSAFVEAQEQGVLPCFRLVKTFLEAGYGGRELGWTVITRQCLPVFEADPINPAHSSVHGFFGSVAKEYRKWHIRLLDLPNDLNWPLNEIQSLPAEANGAAFALRGGEWYSRELMPIDPSPVEEGMYRRNGVYLVVGGAGGLGEVWTEYMIRTYHAQIVWVGRSLENEEIRTKIKKISALGPTPLYISADATSRHQIQSVCRDVKARFGHINGVVHSAIVLDDHSVARMDEKSFRASLEAKVNTSVQIGQIAEEDRPDFLLFFSSIQSFLNAPGQSNYAAGCAFKDAFATYLHQTCGLPVKIMNWGYWGSAGIVASDQYRERLFQQGFGSIEPDRGMEALETLMAVERNQLAFVKTARSVDETLEQIREAEASMEPANNLSDVHQTLRAGPERGGRISLAQESALDGILAKLLFVALGQKGVFRSDFEDVEAIRRRLQIVPQYGEWFTESLRILSRYGFVELDGTRCRLTGGSVDEKSARSEWEDVKRRFGGTHGLAAHIDLADATLSALLEIISGHMPVHSVMFPNSSLRLVEAFYKNNPVGEYLNGQVAKNVFEYVAERVKEDPGLKIRILEVGSGTGATTSSILEQLDSYKSHVAEYCYTDVSQAFLRYGAKLFAETWPVIEFRYCDIEKPLIAQGFEGAGYDIVVAANVLHAVENVEQSASYLHSVMLPNGLLAMSEIAGNTVFRHLTFGLLDGWWRFRDRDIRLTGGPALSEEKWRAVLSKAGFESVAPYVNQENAADYQLLTARAAQEEVSDVDEYISAQALFSPISAEHTMEAEHYGNDEVTHQDNFIRRMIRSSVVDTLRCDPSEIDDRENLADYGVDSIIAVNLINTINDHLSTDLPPTVLFDYSSVDLLVEYILQNCTVQSAPSPQAGFGSGIGRAGERETASDHINQLCSVISSCVSQCLKCDPSEIDPSENLADYGVDSIIAVNLTNLISERLGIELPTTLLFDYNRVDLLASYIAQKHGISLPASVSNTEDNSVPVDEIDYSDEGYRHRGILPDRPEVTSKYSVRDGNRDQPIAIIGISGRFPKSPNVESFWKHLASGHDLVDRLSRWDLSAFNKEENFCSHGGFLEGIDLFDPQFFKISGAEAKYMDPQQRLFLEESWKAIEDAGYAGCLDDIKRSGVFVGCATGDYARLFGREPVPQSFWGNATSTIAARVAHHLNFQGPAMAVETACSSSLVAVHLACQSLRNGEIDAALAGGVFLLPTPAFYISAERAKLLSADGRCYAFDSRANGFVPGEAVGVIVLKRLEQAQRDKDNIYGVIKGSAINHDGTTNGLTAPSVLSQERLETSVYDELAISPRDLQLVEANGTGTKFGDPVEFQALKSTFSRYTEEREFCALGSVKTNIGNSIAASGIAGIIKILMSLKYGKIPPSLHFEKFNPNISAEDGPLFVNTTLRDWRCERARKRMAAVSSFGLSGTNAHMVIEEAPDVDGASDCAPGYLAVLSARTPEQLRSQVRELSLFCQENLVEPGDLSFTLLMGRKQFKHRLAFVVSNTEEFVGALNAWLEGRETSAEILQDIGYSSNFEDEGQTHIARALKSIQLTTSDADYRRALRRLGELFVSGNVIDFSGIFQDTTARRVSLPTYPFARQRYWVADAFQAEIREAKADQGTPQSHPFIQVENSEGAQDRPSEEANFTSQFSGKEFFLADHVVNGRAILSGAATLELVRAAAENFLDGDYSENIVLNDVTWIRPLASGEGGLSVFVNLSRQVDGQWNYSVTSKEKTNGSLSGTCTSGHFRTMTESEQPGIDLRKLELECDHVIPSETYYPRFEAVGLSYGASHQGLKEVCRGHGRRGEKQILARIELPDQVAETFEQFKLHPSLLDAALQASLFLFDDEESGERAAPVPFALGSLEMWAQCPRRLWSWVRFSSSDESGTRQKDLDIDIIDEEGRVCVRLKRLKVRKMVLQGQARKKPVKDEPHLFGPVWCDTPLQSPPRGGQSPSVPFDRHIVFVNAEGHAHQLSRLTDGPAEIDIVGGGSGNLADRFRDWLLHVCESLRTRTAALRNARMLIQVLVDDKPESQMLRALWGMLSAVRLEVPKVTVQIIICGAGENAAIRLLEEAHIGEDGVFRYGEGHRQKLCWEELEASDLQKPWEDEGVYLVTGGAGKLGLAFANEIARSVRSPKIILAGRSNNNETIETEISKLRHQGADAVYRQADMSCQGSVTDLVRWIEMTHLKLDGVVHCAGVLRDKLLRNKKTGDIVEVFDPKGRGALNLDCATRAFGLKFFVLCSSIAPYIGSVGQADYAAANAFLDHYAEYRAKQVSDGARNGHTLSIAWPLWSEGGMQADSKTVKAIAKMGLVPLPTRDAMNAFYRAMAARRNSVVLLYGNSQKFPAEFRMEQRTNAQSDRSMASQAMGERERRRLEDDLIGRASIVLEIQESEIDLESELSEFGFDSLSFSQFVDLLNKDLDLALDPTIVFEYPTLRKLAHYISEKHGGKFSRRIGNDASSNQQSYGQPGEAVKTPSKPDHSNHPMGMKMVVGETAAKDIAVVGLSCHFPSSGNVQEFWNNLIEERDCIGEVPRSRREWHELEHHNLSADGLSALKWGGFVDGVDEFDPLFFNISPAEAELIDPQHRLLMTHVWNALEDAGYAASNIAGSNAAVFLATGSSGYAEVLERSGSPIGSQSATGIVSSTGPNRISYFLDIHGPSEPVETACSSSLVAIHKAVRALRDGDCQLAFAGGVNTLLTPDISVSVAKAGMLSADGRCKAFSKDANGYVRSEGVGVLALKKLEDAERDGDQIHAVIRGTALNHGGRAQSFTAPNPLAQADLVKSALKDARVEAERVGYVETHGTGTILGDPVELNGLNLAFGDLIGHGESRPLGKSHCGIGSVKSNLGHLEMAAGVASVVKVILQLKHKQLVKSLHCESRNPHLDLDGGPFYLVDKTMPWDALQDENGNVLPRVAGVSSFGFGGVNAHVIIEEYADGYVKENASSPAMQNLFVLSAANQERLCAYAESLKSALSSGVYRESDLTRIAYTLQVGREQMAARLAVVAETIADLQQELSKFLDGDAEARVSLVADNPKSQDKNTILDADDDLHELARSWLEKGKYTELGRLWLKGIQFDWNCLYENPKPKRISLPTYPFVRQRFWAPGADGRSPSQESSISLAPKAHIQGLEPSAGGEVLSDSKAQSGTRQGKPFALSTPYDKQGEDTDLIEGVEDLPPTVEIKDQLTHQIVEQISGMLKLPQEMIDLDENFDDIGFSSVKLSEFAGWLSDTLGIELLPAVFFSYPTIRSFVDHFLDEYKESAHLSVRARFERNQPLTNGQADLASFEEIQAGDPEDGSLAWL